MVCSCRVAPEARFYFNRAHPFQTVSGFVYAVRAGQWDFAYNSLSRATREDLSATKFYLAVQLISDPTTGVPIYDTIVEAQRDRSQLMPGRDAGHCSIFLYHSGTTPPSGDADAAVATEIRELELDLTLEPDETSGRPEWKIDLARTVSRLGARLE